MNAISASLPFIDVCCTSSSISFSLAIFMASVRSIALGRAQENGGMRWKLVTMQSGTGET